MENYWNIKFMIYKLKLEIWILNLKRKQLKLKKDILMRIMNALIMLEAYAILKNEDSKL